MTLRKIDAQAFIEGKVAFYTGLSSEACPYEGKGRLPNQSDKRLDWMNGYYQAKYGDKWEEGIAP